MHVRIIRVGCTPDRRSSVRHPKRTFPAPPRPFQARIHTPPHVRPQFLRENAIHRNHHCQEGTIAPPRSVATQAELSTRGLPPSNTRGASSRSFAETGVCSVLSGDPSTQVLCPKYCQQSVRAINTDDDIHIPACVHAFPARSFCTPILLGRV